MPPRAQSTLTLSTSVSRHAMKSAVALLFLGARQLDLVHRELATSKLKSCKSYQMLTSGAQRRLHIAALR